MFLECSNLFSEFKQGLIGALKYMKSNPETLEGITPNGRKVTEPENLYYILFFMSSLIELLTDEYVLEGDMLLSVSEPQYSCIQFVCNRF